MNLIKDFFSKYRFFISISIFVCVLLLVLVFVVKKPTTQVQVVVNTKRLLDIPTLTKLYGFSLKEGVPFLTCYPNNPLTLDSKKESYVVCDSRVAGEYVGVLWRDIKVNVSRVEYGTFVGLLKSPGAEVTLGSVQVSAKNYTCFRDKNFTDTVTGMNGYFVNCSVKNPDNRQAVTLFVSFFHFVAYESTGYGNTVVFSNIGSGKKISQQEFIDSVYPKIAYLQKTENPTKHAFLWGVFEKAYAGGDGGGSSGGSETGTSCCVTDASGNNWTDGSGNPIGYGGGSPSSGNGGGGNGGSGSYVPAPTTPPDVSFSASSNYVTWNTPVTLSWTSSQANSCTASGDWTGSVPLQGPQSSPLITHASTFNLYCSNAIGDSPVKSVSVNTCPEESPTWDGAVCRTPSGTITGSSCSIPLGSGSCAMNVVWSTQYPSGVPEVRRFYDGGSVLATGASGNGSYTFPYQKDPYILDLYDRAVKLDSANFTAHCTAGGFDTLSNTCVNPVVTSVTVTGQYYSTTGHIAFTCSDADTYKVLKSGEVFASGAYTGKVTLSVTDTANYSMICMQGNYESTPEVRVYHGPPPPPPVVAISSSPRSVVRNGATTLSFSVQFPINTCTISARAVCTNNNCSEERISYQDTLNGTLLTTTTDDGKDLLYTLRNIPLSHMDTDWKTSGKKTLKIPYSTDFILKCGNVEAKTRVLVTSSKEM